MQTLSIDQSVLDTVDPDRWYIVSNKLNERATFLDRLQVFKSNFAARPGESVSFLGILVAACNKKSALELEAIAQQRYTRKKDPGFAHDIVEREESRRKRFDKEKLEAEYKLQQAEQKIFERAPSPNPKPSKGRKKTPDQKQTLTPAELLRKIKKKEEQIAGADQNLIYATKVEKNAVSTDYHFKILDNSMVLSTFGETFYRLLQGRKGKQVA